MKVVHTSAAERGQIYVPMVNWALMVACVGLVLGFRTSTALAAAYGVAVTMTMVITTLLYYLVVRDRFKWSLWQAAALCGFFLVVDLAFFGANIPKIPHDGWCPIVAGGIVFAVLTTWFTGRNIVRDRTQRGRTRLDEFLETVWEEPPARDEGTAVYLYGVSGMAPPPMIYNLRSNHVFHERVLAVNVVTDRVPRVRPDNRVREEEHPARRHPGGAALRVHGTARRRRGPPPPLRRRPAGDDILPGTRIGGRHRTEEHGDLARAPLHLPAQERDRCSRLLRPTNRPRDGDLDPGRTLTRDGTRVSSTILWQRAPRSD